jgi:hypothetical protein
MPGVKRHHDGMEKETESRASPFMPMFEVFRTELDEHHDRRERIIKASRVITAASKKMYVQTTLICVLEIITDDLRQYLLVTEVGIKQGPTKGTPC